MAGFFQTPEQPGYRALADYFQNSKVANPAGNPIGRAAATNQPRMGGGLPAPSGYMPQSFPQRTPQSNPLGFLNDAGQPGTPSRTPGASLPMPDFIAGQPGTPSRTPGASLPMPDFIAGQASTPPRTPGAYLPTPDFIAGNPGYATQTQSLSQVYNNALGNDVYAKWGTLMPGSAEYQTTRQTLGLPAEGSGPMYSRQYMAPGGTASGISSVAPGQGTVSVMGQGNGGTVEGNVAAINRQTAALQDLHQAQLDDPYNGRFRFGTDGIRRGVDPLDVASGRTDALGTLLPDVSRSGPRSQLKLADLMQQANIASLQDARAGQQQKLQGQANANSALSDLFRQQQQGQQFAANYGLNALKFQNDVLRNNRLDQSLIDSRNSQTASDLFRQQQQGQQFAANYGLNALKFQNDVLRNNRLDQSLIDSRNAQTAKDQRLTPDQMVANWMDIYTNSPDQQQRQNALNYLTQYYQLKSPQAGAL